MFFIRFLFVTTCYGFIPMHHKRIDCRNTKLQQNGNENIDAPILYQLQNQAKLPEISITELIHDIDTLDIEKIYLSNDETHIYAKHSSVLQLKELLTPSYPVSTNSVDDIASSVSKTDYYTITESNKEITNSIVYHSVTKGVETIIMKPYVNVWTMITENVGVMTSNLFSTAILVFFVRYLYQSFMMGISGGMMGGMGGVGGMRRGGMGGGIGFPSSMFPMDMENVTESSNNGSRTGFASWAGSPEIYEECMEVVSYIRNSSYYESAGIEIPKGILLEGPPGTGKTMLARTIANEANANFIYISASELIELYSGLGALRVRILFEMARMSKPTIIFMDEIDAIGKKRTMSLGGGSNEEREQTLNQLLSELDGFIPNEGILFLGATNRKDILDDALLRPGRFDKIITIPYPDKNSRRAILEKFLSNKNVSSDISLDVFSEITDGFSGAELKKLVNEGMMNTFRRSDGVEIEALSAQDLYDSLEKMTIGILRKNDTRSETILFRIAIHELGHGLIAHHFADSFILQKISIQSSYSGAGGYTLFTENASASEEGLYTRDFLKKRLILCLGGRVAEDIFYGKDYISLGATQDLKEANQLARRMVDFYGMGEGCLETYYNTRGEGEKLSNYTLELIEKEIAGILQECYEKAREIFSSYDSEKILFLVRVLLSNNTIQGGFLRDYFDGKCENDCGCGGNCSCSDNK